MALLRTFATNRLLIRPIARIQSNGVCRFTLVNILQICYQLKIHGLVWPPGGARVSNFYHFKHTLS